MRNVKIALFVAALTAVGAGCATQSSVELPPVPPTTAPVFVPEITVKAVPAAEEPTVPEKSTTMAPKPKGGYMAYDSAKLSNANNGDVVLFFYAPWCPYCRAAEEDINANLENLPEGLFILKIDYDSETELKKKYGVTYQHTFVQVDAQGNLLKKWTGSFTLDAVVKEVL